MSAELKLLIVDDDPTIRSTLAEIVSAWGYRTFAAASLAEALAIVDRERPDAVLLDVKLPDGSGISILDELKRRLPEVVIIVITGFSTHNDAFEAGSHHAYGYVSKPIDQIQMRSMLDESLKYIRLERSRREARHARAGETKRGRPQGLTASPLGKLILSAMKLLGLSYMDVVSETKRLALLNNNSDMRIAKATLGNIIKGTIRQPGKAKLDSLRIILNLSRAEMDAAIGLQPERHFTDQLEVNHARTHEVPIDSVTRQRQIKIPILRDDAKLEDTQFLDWTVASWENIEVEYLSSFFPPHLCYVVIGDDDANASPIAPPGSRVLVNKLLTTVQPPENVSFHERELFYVLTPNGHTCGYLELVHGNKIVLIPHPESGKFREEFNLDEITIIGQVVGVLYPKK